MSNPEAYLETLFDEVLKDTNIGVTIPFTDRSDEEEEWLRERRGQTICNGKYVVSDRGGHTFIGIRRKSPHE